MFYELKSPSIRKCRDHTYIQSKMTPTPSAKHWTESFERIARTNKKLPNHNKLRSLLKHYLLEVACNTSDKFIREMCISNCK